MHASRIIHDHCLHGLSIAKQRQYTVKFCICIGNGPLKSLLNFCIELKLLIYYGPVVPSLDKLCGNLLIG